LPPKSPSQAVCNYTSRSCGRVSPSASPSEATGASIEALGTECGHRTLTITRKGGKVVSIPLAPRTARAIDLAIGERCEGPVLGLVLG
jgi:hypothetical protein